MPNPSKRPPSRRRRRVIFAVVATLLLGGVADQLANWLVLGDGWVRGLRIAPFDPPLFSSVQVDAVERLRRELVEGSPPGRPIRFDAELGWGHAPSSGSGEDRFDELGARTAFAPSTAMRREGARRILAFGCSFTYGTEVGAADSWPAQLGLLRPDLELVNLAVPGYGLDQAFLRWRRDGRAIDADEVWIGFLPAAAPRNVNRYRPALSHWSVTVAFKPRFGLAADDALVLIPHPARSLADVVRLTGDAAAFVATVGDDDAFVAGVRPAYLPRGSHWSHHTALGRIAWTLLDRAGREPATMLAEPDHEVFRVTRAIGRTMAGEVAATGRTFRLLVLPDREDLGRTNTDGTPVWSALSAAWRADGIDVLDLSDALRAGGAPDAANLWAEGGHYSRDANALVAARLAAR